MSIPLSHQEMLARSDFKLPIGRSEINQEELKILAQYGCWMEALANGEIEPFTEAQVQFVKVARGRESPATQFERVWVKYAQSFPATEGGNAEFENVMHERLCHACNKPIPVERLEIFPDTTLCRNCQESLESGELGSENSIEPVCPRCKERGLHSKLVYRQARDAEIGGYFLGCSRFPDCRYIDK